MRARKKRRLRHLEAGGAVGREEAGPQGRHGAVALVGHAQKVKRFRAQTVERAAVVRSRAARERFGGGHARGGGQGRRAEERGEHEERQVHFHLGQHARAGRLRHRGFLERHGLHLHGQGVHCGGRGSNRGGGGQGRGGVRQRRQLRQEGRARLALRNVGGHRGREHLLGGELPQRAVVPQRAADDAGLRHTGRECDTRGESAFAQGWLLDLPLL